MKKEASEMTIKELIGQKLMFGFPGETLDDEAREIIRDYKISNVILFKRNIKSIRGLRELCRQIQDLVMETTGHPAIIGVDEEGGCVTRLSPDAAIMPAAMAVAATGDPENGAALAGITARQLRYLGCNMNFVPVTDINSNPKNPIIGGRSYGDTPEKVIKYTTAINEAYKSENFLISAKHFPGHGDTDVDSHLGLPKVTKTCEELETFELLPFKALIDSGIPAVMTTHILFPNIEKENIPGTMSRTIVTDILKNKLGFGGIVVSDCMEMDAIKKFYGTVEGCKKAALAGVDIICVSHTPEFQRGAALELAEMAEDGTLDRFELMESVEKILSYKEKYCGETAEKFDFAEAKASAAKVREASITLLGKDIPDMGESPIFIGCKDFRSANVSDEDDRKIPFCEYMSSRFGGIGVLTSKNPDSDEIKSVLEKAAGHSSIFVNTFNGHVFRGQIDMVNALHTLGIPMIAIAFRDPYDLCHIDSSIPGICAWDYTPMTLDALAPVLSGECKPAGKVPVEIERKPNAPTMN